VFPRETRAARRATWYNALMRHQVARPRAQQKFRGAVAPAGGPKFYACLSREYFSIANEPFLIVLLPDFEERFPTYVFFARLVTR